MRRIVLALVFAAAVLPWPAQAGEDHSRDRSGGRGGIEAQYGDQCEEGHDGAEDGPSGSECGRENPGRDGDQGGDEDDD